MHKGKSTMHGRIMVGSQAVMSHDGEGQGVFVAYYPPDMHLSQLILAYGHQVAAATGSRLFVMDRAVHSQALARAFDEAGFGLLGMLDDNEHQGLESFEATEHILSENRSMADTNFFREKDLKAVDLAVADSTCI